MTTIQFNQHADLAEAKETYKRRIDAKAGEIRQRFAQDWLIDEDYSGDAPEVVQAWADITDMTGKQATDDILATRDAFNSALEQVRRIRLTGKSEVTQATTIRTAFDKAEMRIAELETINSGIV